ncbi:MAG TPA: alpha/beta hydrolase [Terriglobales bacterium]|nr:alpha/beta hydrolase [Terriglobales bacterium]
MLSDEILTLPPPPADVRIPYGTESHQFGDLRLPKSKGPHPVVMNIHGGYWRSKYDLTHAGHLCAALTHKGLATWNLEYRRVGNEGGGWPGTFADVRNGYRFIGQIPKRYGLDPERVVVMGHSAGGQLALCLAGHDASLQRVVSLAGVIDLQRSWELHLSNNAVAEFLGGPPERVPEHYAEADPMRLGISNASQWVIHGTVDDVVPVDFSHTYYEKKKKQGEDVHLLEIEKAGHFELIDPRSAAWPRIEQVVMKLF